MSNLTEQITQTLQFYSTAEYECSYFPQRDARSEVAAPAHLIDKQIYSSLVRKGFRRSGLFTYRPQCAACNACLPIRVNVNGFKLSRSYRRIVRKNASLNARVLPLEWHDEHYQLYSFYQKIRHPGAGMDDNTEKQYKQFLLTSAVESKLVEFRDSAGLVQIVALVDILDNALSAVYTFFNPHSSNSLGTYSILWQIQRCQELGLPWLYLGYWIQENQKMSYKSKFQPYQILDQGQWRYVK